MTWSAPYFTALSVGGPTPWKRFAISAGFAFCAAFLPWGATSFNVFNAVASIFIVFARLGRLTARIIESRRAASSLSSVAAMLTSSNSSRRRVVRFALVRGANLANPTLGLLALPNSSVRNLVTVSYSSDGYFPIRIFDLDPLPLVSSFASSHQMSPFGESSHPAQPEENFSRVGRGAVPRWL